MKQGDKVKIEVEIDACLFGYKADYYRIKIGENTVWIPAELIPEEE